LFLNTFWRHPFLAAPGFPLDTLFHKEKKLKTTGGAPVIWYWQSRGFYVQDTQKTNHNGAATQHHKGIPVTSLETIDHPSANERVKSLQEESRGL
jgi:hypothetical protein